MGDLINTDQHQFSAIYRATIAYLARREHSRFELAQKLSKRFDAQEPLIDRALDKAAADGYLSDERFAEAYTRSRASKGFGCERIANELRQKGVNTDLIADSLAHIQKQGGHAQALLNTWKKKFNAPPQNFKDKAKQARFLRYRGFNQDEIEQLFASLSDG